MQRNACITLSWDDGHPLDLRIAGMMAKHGLRGTFYVPRTAERGTVSPAQIRELGRVHEIGAHTLGHVVLTRINERQAWQEIAGSKSWIEDVVGAPCLLFCPPTGRFSARQVQMIGRAGFRCVRTVEMLSLDWPRRHGGLLVMPTTIQAWQHDGRSYVQNALKRRAARNLWRYLLHGRGADWTQLAVTLIDEVLLRGGVFHLWGHSWEVEACGGWHRVEDVMRLLEVYARRIPAFTNGEVCRAMEAGAHHTTGAMLPDQPSRPAAPGPPADPGGPGPG